eukprot:2611369-Prymnesium_polylepis.1
MAVVLPATLGLAAAAPRGSLLPHDERPLGSRKRPSLALCLTGQTRGVANATMSSVRERLISRLPAEVDVFVVTTPDISTAELERLAGVPLAGVQRDADPSDVALSSFVTERFIGRDPHYLASWMKGLGPREHLETGTGRWTFSSFLLQVNATQNCLRLMERREASRGYRYDLAMRVRADARWFGELPPAAWRSVELRGSLITPTVSSLIGARAMNDRFIFARRREFGMYASLYHELVAGVGYWRNGSEGLGASFAEQASLMHASHHRIRVHAISVPMCIVEATTYAFDAGATAAECVHCKYGDEGLKALPAWQQWQIWASAKLCNCSDTVMVKEATGLPQGWTGAVATTPSVWREGWTWDELSAGGAAPAGAVCQAAADGSVSLPMMGEQAQMQCECADTTIEGLDMIR